jgi:hypothetical protein
MQLCCQSHRSLHRTFADVGQGHIAADQRPSVRGCPSHGLPNLYRRAVWPTGRRTNGAGDPRLPRGPRCEAVCCIGGDISVLKHNIPSRGNIDTAHPHCPSHLHSHHVFHLCVTGLQPCSSTPRKRMFCPRNMYMGTILSTATLTSAPVQAKNRHHLCT